MLLAASSAVGISVPRAEYTSLDLKDAYMQLRDAFRGASIKIHLYDDNNNVEEQDREDYYYPPSWNYPVGPPYPIPYPYPTAEPPTEPTTKPTKPTLLRRLFSRPNQTTSKNPRRRLISHFFLPNNIFGVSET